MTFRAGLAASLSLAVLAAPLAAQEDRVALGAELGKHGRFFLGQLLTRR